MDIPETRYTKTPDGLSIAYQVIGDGPTNLVIAPTHFAIDVMWEEPSFAAALRRLAGLGRLICLDYRGWGVSDPVPMAALPTPEAWIEDTLAVLDAVGAPSAHLIVHGGSGFVGMLFAATYPDRTDTLTMIEARARTLRSDDYPTGVPLDVYERFVELDTRLWGTPAHAALYAPSRSGDEAFARWSARFQRAAMSPSLHAAVVRWVTDLDLRAVLPSIRVPTLLIHREDGRITRADQGRYLADHIPDARLVTVPGGDYWFFTEHADLILDHVQEFVTGRPPIRGSDRALATVLFTDIVGSTELSARLGDREWTRVLDRHDELIVRELEHHRGQKVNPTGDGILATFDGPTRAVRCAQAICAAVRPLGVEVRAGLHTGEVELRGNDIGGIAVHIGQRISGLGGPGEVLVSRTVTDLVAGSGLEFDDRGEHELKGVPGRWPVFAVRPRPV